MCASDRLTRGLAGSLLALSALLAVAPASAQTPNREQEQLRRLRLQVQQLQQQAQGQAAQQRSLQQAEAELAGLKQALADALAAASRHKRAADRQAREASASQQQQQDAAAQASAAQAAAQQALQAELAAAGQARQALQQAQAGLQRRLAEREADWAALNSRHSQQAQGLQTCIANNQALQALGQDLLQRYARQTVAEVLQRDEPFFQLRRVALENLMQGYRDKLDAQAMAPAATAAVPLAQRLAAETHSGRAAAP